MPMYLVTGYPPSKRTGIPAKELKAEIKHRIGQYLKIDPIRVIVNFAFSEEKGEKPQPVVYAHYNPSWSVDQKKEASDIVALILSIRAEKAGIDPVRVIIGTLNPETDYVKYPPDEKV